MPVLVQPTTTQVDPNQALNVFQTLQEGHRRKELVDAQVARLSSDLAMEKQLQTGRMEEQSLKLESMRIESAQKREERSRNLALRDEWNPEEFSGAIAEVENIAPILGRRQMLAEVAAKYSRFKGIPEAAAFMEKLGGSYGERLDEEWEMEKANGELDLFSTREEALKAAGGYSVSSVRSLFNDTTEYTPNYEKIDRAQESQALMELEMLTAEFDSQDPLAAYSAAMKNDAVRTMSQVSKAVNSQLADLRSRATKIQDSKQADADRLNYSGKSMRQKTDFEWVEEFTSSAGGTQSRIRDLQTGIGLLMGTEDENGNPIEAGEIGVDGVKTGYGASMVMKASQMAAAIGLPIDIENLARKEQVFTLLGSEVMKRVQETKGAVSEKEMALFEEYSAGPNKTPEGNLRILRYALAVARRTGILQDMVMDAQAKGMDPTELRNKMITFRNANELPDINDLAPREAERQAMESLGWTELQVQRAIEIKKQRAQDAVEAAKEIPDLFKPLPPNPVIRTPEGSNLIKR